MIVDALGFVLSRILGDVVAHGARALLRDVAPGRARMPKHPPRKQVVASAGAMFDRAALYETWAEAHGLEWVGRRRAEYAGTYRGRPIEMNTGLVDTPLPKSPEILVRVALDGIEASILLAPGGEVPAKAPLRALASLLTLDGMRDIGVTRAFVRLRFVEFVKPEVFTEAIDALEEVLRSVETSSEASSPYR